MNLYSSYNDLYEKTDMEIGFAVMCSSTPKTSLTHTFVNFLLIFRAQAQYTYRYNKAVPQMAERKSKVTVQRYFGRAYERNPSADKAIQRWFNQFKVCISGEKRKSARRPRTSQEDAERTRLSCRSSPKKCIVRRCW
jgi:hypothetical protein